jgi:hypothetical protein
MIGKYSAIKGFALFIIAIIIQVPCWNSFANSQSGFVVATGIISAALTLLGIFLVYKYEKEILQFFLSKKDETPK